MLLSSTEVSTFVTKGFNCCLFAYGQTGAGKTYSILGKAQDLASNTLCESRGILPRLLNDLFCWQKKWENRSLIKCSYMEIYNEQIFDLVHCRIIAAQLRREEPPNKIRFEEGGVCGRFMGIENIII